MWKIIKQSVEKITINKQKFNLGMKWSFKIDFANDSFWPYNYKFEREDCYFNDWLEDRWTKIFPLKNKKFDNTEIFLETDDIFIAIWERWSLIWWDKTFVDIINIKTEQKQRIFTDEVNLIYNSDDSIIINCKLEKVFKTLFLDLDTLEIKKEKQEELQAFFKSVYNVLENKWYLLDFNNRNKIYENIKYIDGYFKLISRNTKWKPESFNRKTFTLYFDKKSINVWFQNNNINKKKILKYENFLKKRNFINNQNYILWDFIKRKIIIEFIKYKISNQNTFHSIILIISYLIIKTNFPKWYYDILLFENYEKGFSFDFKDIPYKGNNIGITKSFYIKQNVENNYNTKDS